MAEIDSIFIIYGILTVFLLVMTVIILRKSLSTVNYLFSISPLTYALVIVLNMVNYFVAVPAIIPRIPYLLGPLGIFFAGVYIFKGREFIRDYYLMSFTLLYILYSLILSLYLESHHDSFPTALMHISITFPLIPSLYYYYKLVDIIPDSKYAIYTLLFGELILIIGAVVRSYYFYFVSVSSDFLPGLILVFIGVIVIILSFTGFSRTKSTS